MTRQEAENVARWIEERSDGRKLWSITVSETKKANPEVPTKYRVVIEPFGSGMPLAIYSARVLSKQIAPKESM